MIRRNSLVYGLLLAALISIIVWQVVEHARVKAVARTTVVNRGRDITSILGVVLRSQRRFGVVAKDRVQAALKDLIKPGELSSIVLLNAAGEEVVSVGEPVNLHTQGKTRTGVHWEEGSVTLANLVDLGTNNFSGSGEPRPTIVINRPSFPDTNRPPPEAFSSNMTMRAEGPPPPRNFEGRSGEGRGGSPFGRPPWMSEEEYKTMLHKQGLHSFLIVMPTEHMVAATQQDLWMRIVVCAMAGVAAVGFGVAWRNLTKSSELQLRLVRASELNTHLKEMNVAVAGLAHETRNPLNIVRGLAQMISKEPAAPVDVREKSRSILDEVDRVTAQLNEFINYTRPRETRLVPVQLSGVVDEVARALNYDVEEKRIKLQTVKDPVQIQADEQLLRQALFNLLLNAVQAVGPGGQIQVSAARASAGEYTLEIADDGPGVPVEQRRDIFKPYFTTNQKGTGLGLAVVQQIVSAHGWEIECDANQPKGALFRIKHLKPSVKT